MTAISTRLDGQYTRQERYECVKITTRGGNKLKVQVLTDRNVGFNVHGQDGKEETCEFRGELDESRTRLI